MPTAVAKTTAQNEINMLINPNNIFTVIKKNIPSRSKVKITPGNLILHLEIVSQIPGTGLLNKIQHPKNGKAKIPQASKMPPVNESLYLTK